MTPQTVLETFDAHPSVFAGHTYGVDSGGLGLFPDETVIAWEHGVDPSEALQRHYRHNASGQLYVQGKGAIPQGAIGFFSFEAPLKCPEGEKTMNAMIADGDVQRLPREVIGGLHYAGYSSITCGEDGYGFTQDAKGRKVFYSHTTWGDGGYGVYQHPESGAILIDTDNTLDIHAEGNAEDDDEAFNPHTIEAVELGEITINSHLTLIDPCYLDSGNSGGVTLPIKSCHSGSYTLYQLRRKDCPKEERNLRGYLLLPQK